MTNYDYVIVNRAFALNLITTKEEGDGKFDLIMIHLLEHKIAQGTH